jgi:hypothetical protein
MEWAWNLRELTISTVLCVVPSLCPPLGYGGPAEALFEWNVKEREREREEPVIVM